MHPFAATLLAAALLGPAASAAAQGARPRPAAPAPATPAATPAATPTPAPAPVDPNPAAPQQTTATFGDWTLRCTRSGAAAQSCEIVQGITSQERTVAQIAMGRAAKGQPLLITILVPPSVSFARAPALATMQDAEPPVLDLVWRHCLPVGCMADAALSEDVLRRVRGWTDPARIVFTDAGGRGVALPFSPHGLTQALNALAKGETE